MERRGNESSQLAWSRFNERLFLAKVSCNFRMQKKKKKNRLNMRGEPRALKELIVSASIHYTRVAVMPGSGQIKGMWLCK